MPIGTTNFPTSLDTSSTLVEVADNALTTLDGALNNSDTTITVVSTTLFPTTGILTIDDEKISYTGKTGSTFTGCTRGFGGTSAASHLTAANVEILIIEEMHRVHSAALIAIETKLGTGSAIAVNKLAALTASIVPITDASGFLSSSAVTPTELGYLSGVTSAIQTQLGNKQGLDATLTALAAHNANGLLTQTAADTFTGRTLTGTSNRLSVTNGDGVSGNPTVDISSSYAGQATITTLGTITTGTWNGTAIGAAYIGDLSAVYQPLDADLTAIAALSANGFLKKTAGTWGMDSSTYLTANQTITLSGDVSGTGTTAITTSIGAGVVTNTMLAGSIALSKLSITGTPDGTKFLRDDGSWQTASGGGGTPGGSTKQVQFNNSSAFGGAAGFEYQSGSSPNVLIQAQNATYVPLIIKGAASQSANVQQWQDSSGSVMLAVSSAGVLTSSSTMEFSASAYSLTATGGGYLLFGVPPTDGDASSLLKLRSYSGGHSAGVGGGIGFEGEFNSGPTYGLLASIRGIKENSTSGDYASALLFITRVNGGALTERLRITSAGHLTIADAGNIVVGTSTGTKIGTATGQKIGFWNATPVVQQVLATGAAHSVDDVIGFLQTVGLCKQS